MNFLAVNIGELVTAAGGVKRGAAMGDAGCIKDGAFYVSEGKIEAVGTRGELEKICRGAEILDCGGALVTPGFADSHTHLVFAGERSEEFSMRLRGEPYMKIMERGGGIAATVAATRAASEEELVRQAEGHLEKMLAFGVTTCEVKSGYGLDEETELKQLSAVKTLNERQKTELVPTYLGAHAVPAGETAESYIDRCVERYLPKVAESGLAEFADIFCEKGVFSLEQSERYLKRAKELGLKLKLHADEMFPLGGAGLGARLGAVSADHLLKIREEDVLSLARSGTIATVLPLTAFCLGEEYAPARKLIDAGAAVAVASDFNPGSCCTYQLPLAFALCCIYLKMSVEETLTAMTINGAAACGREKTAGSIEVGKQADFVIFSCKKKEFLPYFTGMNLVKTVFKKGERVYG